MLGVQVLDAAVEVPVGLQVEVPLVAEAQLKLEAQAVAAVVPDGAAVH